MAKVVAREASSDDAGGRGYVKRFLIACGGTGGHLSPGIALAEGLHARGHVVTLLISQKKVDARLIEKYPHLDFIRVPAAPFTFNPVGFIRFVVRQMQGVLFCRKLIRHTRPSAVVGFGGFTTAAIVLTASLAKVPVVLHEANRVPGRAVRMLARWARRVYLPAGVKLAGLKSSVVRAMGLPVRKEIQREEREEACLRFGLDARLRTLVILGGSQGATALNDWARAQSVELARSGVQVYCVTGLGKAAGAGQQPPVTEVTGQAIFSAFCDDMAGLMSTADLVISRAGAGTLAELARCTAPAILVPYPHAADNHQQANAAEFARAGGGMVIEQAKMDDLLPAALALIHDEAKLAQFQAALAVMDRDNSLGVLIDDLEEITGGYSESGPTGYRS